MSYESEWGWYDNYESAWQQNESGEKFNEADVLRVQEWNEKAKKVAKQIRSSKQQNNKLAQFLTFLLQTIKSDKIVKDLHSVFFKTKNHDENVTYIRKKINIMVVSWVFVPFYPEKVKEFWLNEFYWEIYDHTNPINLTIYLDYLKKLSQTYHDNVPLDKGHFLNFLADIVIYYDLLKPATLDHTGYQEVRKGLEQKLYPQIKK